MARTNSIWILTIYLDKNKKDLFKALEFNNLREIAYCLDKEIYDISNFYHKITKPKEVIEYLYLYKSY